MLKLFTLTFAILLIAPAFTDSCIDDCVDKMIRENPSMIDAVAWHICKDECEKTQPSLGASMDNVRKCVDSTIQFADQIQVIIKKIKTLKPIEALTEVRNFIEDLQKERKFCRDVSIEEIAEEELLEMPLPGRKCIEEGISTIHLAKKALRLYLHGKHKEAEYIAAFLSKDALAAKKNCLKYKDIIFPK